MENIEKTAKSGMLAYYYSDYPLHEENRIRLIDLGYGIKDINNILSDDLTMIYWF